MSDLARRAVACPRWRWMERMQVLYDGTVDYVRWVEADRWIGLEDLGVNVYTGGWRTPSSSWEPDESSDECPPLPDLDDAATKGCLLALVREAHASLQSTEYVGDSDPVNPWRWGAFRGATEEAALVAALDGAP